MLHPRKIIAPALAGLAALSMTTAFVFISSAPPMQDECVLLVEEERYEFWSAESFPRDFEGAFLWDSDTSDQNEQSVRYHIDEVQERGDLLIATGTGAVSYTHFPQEPEVTFDLRIEVDRETGAFEMWEANPSRKENYTVAGKYTAHVDLFSSPRGTISTRWKGDNGQDGTLVLTLPE